MSYFEEGGMGINNVFGCLEHNTQRKECMRKCHALSPETNL
jgi:hypothetical protein